MKFTNGFWVTKPEFKAEYVRDLYDYNCDDDKLTLYMPYKKITGRGDTLNIGKMTLECSSPMEDTLKIKLTGYAGQKKGKPYFETFHNDYKPDMEFAGERAKITSGKLSLCFQKGNPELYFFCGR